MNKTRFFIVILLLIFNSEIVTGQNRILTGRVVDLKTNAPVEFAHVFLSNTTFGRTSDVSGRFFLEKLPAEEFILVVSIVGYETFSGNINLAQGDINNLLIKLIPKVVELEDVSVTGEADKKWNRLYDVFEKEFIGQTFNSENCEIENPWVVEFTEKSKTNNLTVTTSEPIQITNKSLGYSITYYLEGFKYDNGSLNFFGFPIFKYIEATNEREDQYWQKNRKLSYKGSLRHFFYALVNNQYDRDGFSILKLDNREPYNSEEVSYLGVLGNSDIQSMIKEVSTVSDVSYLINFQGNVEIRYNPVNIGDTTISSSVSHFSRVKSLNPDIRCSKTGWVNVFDLEIVGYWTKQRVADMLPYEYIEAP